MIKISFFILILSLNSFFGLKSHDHISTNSKLVNSGNTLIWGINGHPLSQVAYINSSLNIQFQLIKSLGLSYYRIDIPTDDNGNIMNIKRFNQLISVARIFHIKILPVFYLVGFNTGLTITAAFNKGHMLGCVIAKKYGRYFDYYELGNEEEFKIMKPGTDGDVLSNYNIKDGKVLASFLNGMSLGIKSYDTSAKTIIDFAGWLHFGYLKLLQTENVKYDIIGLHWYSEMGKLTDVNSRHFNIINLLAKEFMKPIWITEINKRNDNTGNNYIQQSDWLLTYITEAYKSSYVKAFFVYELFDEPAFGRQPEANYGIIKWNKSYTEYALKPSALILRSQINKF